MESRTYPFIVNVCCEKRKEENRILFKKRMEINFLKKLFMNRPDENKTFIRCNSYKDIPNKVLLLLSCFNKKSRIDRDLCFSVPPLLPCSAEATRRRAEMGLGGEAYASTASFEVILNSFLNESARSIFSQPKVSYFFPFTSFNPGVRPICPYEAVSL